MSFSSLELYAMDKLQCGSADLCMLDNVYSTLGEGVYDTEDLVNEADDLNYLLEYAYNQITEAVKDKIHEIVDDEETLELVVDGCPVMLDISQVADQLRDLADELIEHYAYANCLDTSFQNDLDQTVDWDLDVSGNAEELIEYWISSNKLELPEEKEITAYVLSEDGYDREYERDYLLVGKKVYKDDVCICDMTDEEDIDENFISERICEDCSPAFVKTIELDGEEIFENPEEFETDEDEDE